MTFEEKIRKEILEDEENKELKELGYLPLFKADKRARIALIGQAPGRKAQEAGALWHDQSGLRLMDFLGLDEETFFTSPYIAHLPMDFFYLGKGKHGDILPRKDFAEKWHPKILAHLDQLKLKVLIGRTAQDFYLKGRKEKNLTETVRHYRDYLPDYFPLVHPSPRNALWMKKNPWFEKEVLPDLKDLVKDLLRD